MTTVMDVDSCSRITENKARTNAETPFSESGSKGFAAADAHDVSARGCGPPMSATCP